MKNMVTVNVRQKKQSSNEGIVPIREIYKEYIKYNPDEADKFKLLEKQITDQSDAILRKRTNFIGHVTAAAFIFDKRTRKVLLLQHKALGRLLQPGGHIDSADESPLNAALREMREETGISLEDVVYRQAVPGLNMVPFDIDTHYIPANPKKHEPEHYHHDFRYLFIIDDGGDVAIDKNESTGYQWVEWSDFIKENTFKKVSRKIEELVFKKSALHLVEELCGAWYQH